MARKTKAKQPPAPAASQGAYAERRQRVAALMERKGLSPGVLRRSDGAICLLPTRRQ